MPREHLLGYAACLLEGAAGELTSRSPIDPELLEISLDQHWRHMTGAERAEAKALAADLNEWLDRARGGGDAIL